MIAPGHILVVGGEPSPRNRVVRALLPDPRFLPTHVPTARQAAARARPSDHLWSAIIVDTPLPDSEVPEFCALARRLGLRVPILVVGAASEEAVVRALDAGAIDYLRGRIRKDELAARLHAHIRQRESGGDAWLPIGPYRFRPADRQLETLAGTVRVRLTQKEAEILAHLYQAAGKTVSREVLLREVWNYKPGAISHTVETHVYRLRRKIESSTDAPRLVVNDRHGYRLAAPAAT